MKTVCIVTILFAATMGYDVSFSLNDQDNEPDFVDLTFTNDAHETQETENTELKVSPMGIPVVFVGNAGRCSQVTWVRILTMHENRQSMDSGKVELDFEHCAKVNIPNMDEPSDPMKISQYTDVESVEMSSLDDEITNDSIYIDARDDSSVILIVNLSIYTDERKLKADDRIVKLSISPQGGAELEMGRGPVIV